MEGEMYVQYNFTCYIPVPGTSRLTVPEYTVNNRCCAWTFWFREAQKKISLPWYLVLYNNRILGGPSLQKPDITMKNTFQTPY